MPCSWAQTSVTTVTSHKHITSGELYPFPWAAITSYHHIGGFKQHIFILLISASQRSKISFTGLKPTCGLGYPPWGSFRRIFVCLSFTASITAFLVFLGLWALLPSSKPAAKHLDSVVTLPLWAMILCLPLMRTFVIIFRAQLDNPR